MPDAIATTRLQRFAAAAGRAWRFLCAAARLAIGVPDYDTYVAHLRRVHPDKPVPSYAEFFDERQRARFGGTGSRCC